MKVRVDAIEKLSNSDCDCFLIWMENVSEVPANGETLNIRGNPYIVVDKGWSYDEELEILYCYLRVTQAFHLTPSR